MVAEMVLSCFFFRTTPGSVGERAGETGLVLKIPN